MNLSILGGEECKDIKRALLDRATGSAKESKGILIILTKSFCHKMAPTHVSPKMAAMGPKASHKILECWTQTISLIQT